MTLLFGWAASLVGEKFAKPFTWIVLALLLIGGVFLLGRCSKDDYEDDYRAQIDQTDRSSDAIADAAEGAIEMLEGRIATENAIDQVVSQTVEQIEGAQSPEAVRAAVLAGVCSRREHRNDPACTTAAETRVSEDNR